MKTTSVPARVGLAALASALLLGGCGGAGKAPGKAPAPSSSASAGKAFKAVRWWSNSARASGSAVDINDPTAAALLLRPSRADYCRMLAQTEAAGKTIFGGVAATNSNLQVTITAFAAEIEAVAPSQVSGAWRTLGRAIVTMARSGGDVAHMKGIDAAAVQRAAATISSDASTSCHLSIRA